MPQISAMLIGITEFSLNCFETIWRSSPFPLIELSLMTLSFLTYYLKLFLTFISKPYDFLDSSIF